MFFSFFLDNTLFIFLFSLEGIPFIVSSTKCDVRTLLYNESRNFQYFININLTYCIYFSSSLRSKNSELSLNGVSQVTWFSSIEEINDTKNLSRDQSEINWYMKVKANQKCKETYPNNVGIASEIGFSWKSGSGAYMWQNTHKKRSYCF